MQNWFFNLVYTKISWSGKDLEPTIVEMMRGFAAQEDFLAKFRFKPCAAIIHQIIQRTKNYTEKNHQDKISWVKSMSKELTHMGYFIPGHAVHNRGYWLFPVMVPNSQQFCDFMNKQGFFVFKGSTQMSWVPMPEHLISKYGDTTYLRNYFQNQVCYFPIKTNMSAYQQDAIKNDLLKACEQYQNYIRELKLSKQAPEGSVEDVSQVKEPRN